MTDEIKELKKQVEELKKENTELQRELSVHNFLDTGVPQERLDYQRELKRTKRISLSLRKCHFSHQQVGRRHKSSDRVC